jgi:hypothetical protein
MLAEEMIEKFQCPGCVHGSDTKCRKFDLNTECGVFCENHALGTMGPGLRPFALGLPKGFNQPGPDDSRKTNKYKIGIRLWTQGTSFEWDNLNVPVWAMEEDGFLFVRTYSPRINDGFMDVIESGDLSMVPGAIDVSKFYDEID